MKRSILAYVYGGCLSIMVMGSLTRADEIVPYQATGWRYMQVPLNDPLGDVFWRLDFDDSSWNLGQAAFGNRGGDGCPLDPTVRTHWDASTEMFLRRTFMADPPVTIHFGIDNDAVVYVNAVLITSAVHENCPNLDDFNAVVDPEIIVPGVNLLAVRAIDRGTLSYADMRVEGELLVTPIQTSTWARIKYLYY